MTTKQGGEDLNLHVTMEMVTCIIWKNENLIGAISTSLLDPKQAKQASTTICDAFSQNLMHILGCFTQMGKCHGNV